MVKRPSDDQGPGVWTGYNMHVWGENCYVIDFCYGLLRPCYDPVYQA